MPKPTHKPTTSPSSGKPTSRRAAEEAPEITITGSSVTTRTGSGPEISTGSGTMGRETLVAIAEDEAEEARKALSRRKGPASKPASSRAPRVSSPGPEVRVQTLDFEDHPIDPPSAPRTGSSPDLISFDVKPVGRETMAAISGELASSFMATLSLEEDAAWEREIKGARALESYSFQVLGVHLLQSGPDELRRRFVAKRLLHRLPVKSIDEVEHIDVEDLGDSAALLRVWVPVPEGR